MLAFLVVIGILIFVHELGHFVAARAFGVTVIRFSIGFGPKLLGFERGGTEYVVGALPLGGYVLMDGMHPDDDDGSEGGPRGGSLLDKPLWQRAIVSLAGPLMNVVIAVPLFVAVEHDRARDRLPPTVGNVIDGLPADLAGIENGDRIVRIGTSTVRWFDDVQRIVRDAPGQELEIELERDGTRVVVRATADAVASPGRIPGIPGRPMGQLGIMSGRPRPLVAVTAGAASSAGLRDLDLILAVDGQSIVTFEELEDALAAASGPVALRVARTQPVDLGWAQVGETEIVDLVLPIGGAAASIGIARGHSLLAGVEPGSPAAQAGLLRGDEILSADGRAVSDVGVLVARIIGDRPERVSLEVRDATDAVRTVEITPQLIEVMGEFRTPEPTLFVGLVPSAADAAYAPADPVPLSGGERLVEAVRQGLASTAEAGLAVVLGVFYMVVGQLDSSNLGGPLLIADVVSRASQAGLLVLFGTMASISMNLAVLNLLPVPGLDGGTLALIGVEGARGRPPSARTRQILAYAGVVCIVLLMLFAFKNDAVRYWESVANWINS